MGAGVVEAHVRLPMEWRGGSVRWKRLWIGGKKRNEDDDDDDDEDEADDREVDEGELDEDTSRQSSRRLAQLFEKADGELEYGRNLGWWGWGTSCWQA